MLEWHWTIIRPLTQEKKDNTQLYGCWKQQWKYEKIRWHALPYTSMLMIEAGRVMDYYIYSLLHHSLAHKTSTYNHFSEVFKRYIYYLITRICKSKRTTLFGICIRTKHKSCTLVLDKFLRRKTIYCSVVFCTRRLCGRGVSRFFSGMDRRIGR